MRPGGHPKCSEIKLRITDAPRTKSARPGLRAAAIPKEPPWRTAARCSGPRDILENVGGERQIQSDVALTISEPKQAHASNSSQPEPRPAGSAGGSPASCGSEHPRAARTRCGDHSLRGPPRFPAQGRLQREGQTRALGPAGALGRPPPGCPTPVWWTDEEGPRRGHPESSMLRGATPALGSTGCVCVHPENGVQKHVLPREPRARPVERAGVQLQRGQWPLCCCRVSRGTLSPKSCKSGVAGPQAASTPQPLQVRALGFRPDRQRSTGLRL